MQKFKLELEQSGVIPGRREMWDVLAAADRVVQAAGYRMDTTHVQIPKDAFENLAKTLGYNIAEEPNGKT